LLKAIRSSLDSWLEWLRHVISSVDVGELNLILLIICIVVEASEHDWFSAKHDWDKDNNNHKESHTNAVLDIIGRSNDWLQIGSAILVPISKLKDLGDHDVDDRWCVYIFHVTIESKNIVSFIIYHLLIISIIKQSVR